MASSWTTGRSAAIGRLLDALGLTQRGVRAIDVRIRMDEPVRVTITCERMLHEEELDALSAFLSDPDVQPVIDITEEERP